MNDSSEIEQLERRSWRRGYWGILGAGLALVIVWAILLKIVSQGWGILAVNIGFLIATILTIGMGSVVFFRRYMRTGFAVLLAAIIWVAMAVGIRSIILTVIGL